MRPLDRGPVPVDQDTGSLLVFKHYKDAKIHLINRMGKFCAYCEIRLTQLIEVEHIQSKLKFPHLKNEWSNFVLSCKQCNAAKLDENPNPDDWLRPDRDNTSDAFRYRAGVVVPNSKLSPEIQARAARTIALAGLARIPTRERLDIDFRWSDRRDCEAIARKKLEEFHAGEVDAETIAELAFGYGFWGIWYITFEGVPEVRRLLSRSQTEDTKQYQGTAACFDENGNPLPRPGDLL